MLFFPILFLFALVGVCLSPLLIWAAVPPPWHKLLTLCYAIIALVVLAFWLRAFVRDRIEMRNNAAASADWRWSPRTSAELFRRRVEIFLAMRGWHIASSSVVARARVALFVQKERYGIALLFVGPHPPAADAADVAHMQAIRNEVRANIAALVTATPCGSDALAAVRDANLLLLRYADIARLDEILSQTFGGGA